MSQVTATTSFIKLDEIDGESMYVNVNQILYFWPVKYYNEQYTVVCLTDHRQIRINDTLELLLRRINLAQKYAGDPK